MINEVIGEVLQKANCIMAKTYKSDPKIAVYMDIDCYYQCKSEISGGVSPEIFDFYEKDTICGFPVFCVAPNRIAKHPPWRVVNLDG